MLCQDVINEILSYCNSETVTSFHLINRHMSSKASTNHVIKNRKLLAAELRKTVDHKRKYYKSEILNLKIGDRVTDRNYNYRVCYVEKKMALLELVDLYGNILSTDVIYTKIESMKNYRKSKADKNSLFWATYHVDDLNFQTYVSRLMYGVIKHDHGPMITNVNSIYLNHITNPHITLYKNYHVGEPQHNMIVTVNYKWIIFEYYISQLSDDKMTLILIKNNSEKDPGHRLTAEKINNKWVMDNKQYSIVLFGGWITYF